MSGKVGSITTKITADGLVFNMDAANRACYPKTGRTATDTINILPGTLTNDTNFITLPASSSCFAFDGVDDYINFGTSAHTEISGDMTINAWVYPLSGIDEYARIITKRDSGGTNYQYYLDNSSPRKQRFFDGDGSSIITSTTALSFSTWNNVCISIKSGVTNGSTMYLNGVADGTGTSTITSNDASLAVGASITFSGADWKGNISCIQIYNRALSATEVMKNFNALKDRIGYVAPLIVSFLVVAGGGAGTGGAQQGIGGPGAGGLRTSFGSTSGGGASAEDTLTLLPGTSYTVTVGAGGASSSHVNNANKGNDSVFSTVTSEGGGKGGDGNNVANGGNGGSGGGGGRSRSGGSGTAGQGFDGGDPVSSGANYIGGGGGGASEAGKNGSAGGGGGDGLAVAITGTSVTYAGGGGAGVFSPTSQTPPPGGAGGGGTGGVRNGDAPTAGGVNTGGGGGAARGDGGESSAAGGSGVVILRYPSSNSITVGAGLTSSTSTDGSFKVTTFTAGTDTISFS